LTLAFIKLVALGYMTTHIEDAKAFRIAYGQPLFKGFHQANALCRAPMELQTKLIKEEALEFEEAVYNLLDRDFAFQSPEHSLLLQENILKELADLVFTAYQFAAAFNLDLDEALKRVFISNMSKLGDDGKPLYRTDGKVMKGNNYAPPTLQDLVTSK
jgi:NTP pyrophosphatase (non-canonical NTP hydrolase)